jgi:hypothetical protein
MKDLPERNCLRDEIKDKLKCQTGKDLGKELEFQV